MPSNHLRSLSILQSLMLNSDFRAKDIWLEGRVAYGPEECVCVGGALPRNMRSDKGKT